MQRLPQQLADEKLGDFVRQVREARLAIDPSFSVRQLAIRCGVSPAFLSRFERGDVPPPSERVLLKLASELGQDPDVLLAMAGKISADLRAAILARPKLFAELIRAVRVVPDHALLRVVREVRDGDW
ncbi:helix-turn-helix domain-containing protein [Sandarakinorhabdus limnophila]|uniref:helix-turn-helix domain-containing protein n=1 Tax=Sandarakinorhabdus limnophila TaxID=210512 RepID=UPI0026E96DED|nr:helix-turn-helix transcriptional regulator [Sandarakinorhabdus limnophila]MCM0032770.1 helix-turn-helix domain-containing protein [Sandarakinorhabdus limnophila]